MPQPDVSVVVPTYKGSNHIGACLHSLARQSLAAWRYEVIVVQNGPSDGTAAILAHFAHQYPALMLRPIALSIPGAGLARNVGLRAARGRFVTFVDDDDTVSPTYLQVLLVHSSADRVGLAQLADISDQRKAPNFDNSSLAAHLAAKRSTVPANEIPVAMAYTAAKMLPTDLARTVGFDADLRSGEDIVFWSRVFATRPFSFELTPFTDHAVYYRTVRPNSVSRQETSYDFNVNQRLEVISRLDKLRSDATSELTHILKYLERGQAGFINRYLRKHPDMYATVLDEIASRGLSSISIAQLKRGVARDLAILYMALPYADTSSLVAARRMRKERVLRDVLSSTMDGIRELDTSAQVIWKDYVDQAVQTKTRPTSAWWPGVLNFCRLGMEQIAEWERSKGPYRSVYSRAMWPASHVLAALYKARNPDVHWIAEFSDPLMHGVKGELRVSTGKVEDAIMEELRSALERNGYSAPDDENMYAWIETLVYGLADRIMFTNEKQREFMFEYFPDRALIERAKDLTFVDAHPTLPEEFYHIHESDYTVDRTVANIGYFGVFYATRGLNEVIEALQRLDTASSSALRLHIFTPDPDLLTTKMSEVGLGHLFIARPYVSYLEFLNLTTKFDVLLVNDARTSDTHSVNPYMPSKWSDYIGSGSRIWGVVEPGSVLSTRKLDYRSQLGDVAGACEVLRQIAAEKLGTQAPTILREPQKALG